MGSSQSTTEEARQPVPPQTTSSQQQSESTPPAQFPTLKMIKSEASLLVTIGPPGFEAHNSSSMFILANSNGEILSVSRTFEERLKYKLGSLRGNHIGEIMTPFMSLLHRKVFLKRYEEATPMQRNVIALNLTAKTSGKRPLLVFDALREPVPVNLHIEVRCMFDQNTSKFSNKRPPSHALSHTFTHITTRTQSTTNNKQPIETSSFRQVQKSLFANDDSILAKEEELVVGQPYLFVAELTIATNDQDFYFCDSVELFSRLERLINCDFEVCHNAILVNIDLVGSTQLLSDHGVPQTIHVSKKFYSDIVELVRSEYYPYISIYEIVGDGFVLLLNATWTYNLPMISAMIALNFAVKLLAVSSSYIDARVGISMGEIYYGFIGKKLRIFGEAMNESARLQSVADSGTIVLNREFYAKLNRSIASFGAVDSLEKLSAHCKEMTCNLKGLGDRQCFHITPPKISTTEESTIYEHAKGAYRSNNKQDFMVFKE